MEVREGGEREKDNGKRTDKKRHIIIMNIV